jgi:glycosyltransferase involved in cell wall biosynthesis
MKKIISCATSDLVTDQRIHRISKTLIQQGFQVLSLGRERANSLSLSSRSYECRRLKTSFEKGPLFYVEFNFRLFFYLIGEKADVMLSNDLDTLMACAMASIFKGVPLVYDSHEYYTEVPELVDRRGVRAVWKLIERLFIRRAKAAFTVSESIASAYEAMYKIKFSVVRNLPEAYNLEKVEKTRARAIKKEGFRILLYQGSVNVDRGLEEIIEAMQYMPLCLLYIIGEGDVLEKLKEDTRSLDWKRRIFFLGRMPMAELPAYTIQADLGLSIEKANGLSYAYAMPNKLFDYVQAGIPSLISNLPEMKKINEIYDIAEVLEDHAPKNMAQTILRLFHDKERYEKIRDNAMKARKELIWENESTKINQLFSDFLDPVL